MENNYSDVAILGLTVRTSSCLQRAGVSTISDVLNMSDEDMLSIRHFGLAQLYELKMKLAEHGFISLETANASLNLAGFKEQDISQSIDWEEDLEYEEEEILPLLADDSELSPFYSWGNVAHDILANAGYEAARNRRDSITTVDLLLVTANSEDFLAMDQSIRSSMTLIFRSLLTDELTFPTDIDNLSLGLSSSALRALRAVREKSQSDQASNYLRLLLVWELLQSDEVNRLLLDAGVPIDDLKNALDAYR